MQGNTVKITLPAKIADVFSKPRGALRYRGAYGGRGSAKSFSLAKMAAVWGANEKLRILCVRHIQNSIKESFHAELKNTIESDPWLKSRYDVGVDYIRGYNGTTFIFKGLNRNLGSVKSLAQIDLCIVEEAEDVTEEAWNILEPTIRAEKSEIWVAWNPLKKGSPVDQKFRQNTPPRCHIVEMNWRDNPFFPEVLNELRKHQRKTLDPALYQHIWEGGYLELTDAQIFRGKYRVEEFEVDHTFGHPLHGKDFGFARDPSAVVRLYIKGNTLYIRNEAGKIGLELNDTADYVKTRIPEIEKYVIRADCSRPESISYLKNHGLPRIVAAKKWSGSVEDGITFLKSFDKIIIHPECTEVATEFLYYSYKKDPRTGDVLPIVVDAYNHYIDAIRYALGELIHGRFGVDASEIISNNLTRNQRGKINRRAARRAGRR